MRCPRLACIWMCFALYAVVAFFLSIRFLCYIHSHRVSVIKLSACIMVLCAACSRLGYSGKCVCGQISRESSTSRHKGDQPNANNEMKLDFITISNRFLCTSMFCGPVKSHTPRCHFRCAKEDFFPHLTRHSFFFHSTFVHYMYVCLIGCFFLLSAVSLCHVQTVCQCAGQYFFRRCMCNGKFNIKTKADVCNTDNLHCTSLCRLMRQQSCVIRECYAFKVMSKQSNLILNLCWC